jgi:hypothetical protein
MIVNRIGGGGGSILRGIDVKIRDKKVIKRCNVNHYCV